MLRYQILDVWLDPKDAANLCHNDKLVFDVSDFDYIKLQSAPTALEEAAEYAREHDYVHGGDDA
jgi:hypothetical protein